MRRFSQKASQTKSRRVEMPAKRARHELDAGLGDADGDRSIGLEEAQDRGIELPGARAALEVRLQRHHHAGVPHVAGDVRLAAARARPERTLGHYSIEVRKK